MAKKTERKPRKKVSPRKLERAVQEVLQDRQNPELDPAEVEMELLEMSKNGDW